MCAVDSSLGDVTTALEHEDEVCLLIWHLTSNLSHIWALPLTLSCQLLIDKKNLLIKCLSNIISRHLNYIGNVRLCMGTFV